MKKIPLTQGYFALVDDEDYEWLSKHKWRVYRDKTNCYAFTKIRIGYKEHIQPRMHRLIMNPTVTEQIDHIDGNGLNNRKSNLRICNGQQNQQNRRPTRKASSQYKGVAWHKRSKKWIARITVDKKIIHLGYFNDEESAARVYDKAAKKYFGEFARINLEAC
ncbi:hypothetical protein LCGC14_2446720 [marine sediment metagenome]|uniref:AP2/ERF domain-containing protein n=1 Tax=marine sediment metagenome TaxID=412755 RepID=A0A0F9C4W1_9ZZZZ